MPINKGWLRVCGKTGKVVGINPKYRSAKWLLPFIGLAALIWYLVRVIPKPSRASYPCQQVGAPLALGGITYLLGMLGLAVAFRKGRKFLYENRYLAACVCLGIGFICSLIVKDLAENPAMAQNTGTFTPSDAANRPVGTARGIKPGRVAWAYDLSACNWNGSANYWFSSAYNDQAKITVMMNNTICSVANQGTVKAAWDALFKNKNGGAAYVKGEKIVIKLNLNNNGDNDNQIDASPQTVYALLDGLVNQFGVNQSDIILCDPARENKITAVKAYCVGKFPSVIYNTGLGGFTANAFAYSAAGPTERSLSAAIVNSKYLITMAILKRHCTPSATYGTDGVDYGNASVTLIFKSNWGNIGSKRGTQHAFLRDWNYPMNSYNQLVDMQGSKHINGKTVLNILDGLYSGDRWNSKPRKWGMAPFNGHWPSSIFASQDPVALESVGLDFLRAEMPLIKNADRHIHEAAQANNPPSGTVYKPDGTRLASLGVHEHWNNATDKKYSRNLGTGNGIELVQIPPGGLPPANGTFKIINRNSGKAMDAAGNKTTNGTQIIQWTYGGGNNQRWTLQDRGSAQYSIIGVASGKGLNIPGATTTNGAPVQLYTYSGANNQKFTFTANSGFYRITPVHATGSCLEIAARSTANGALVKLYTYGGGNHQLWSLQLP